jgi:hypothetical protein
VANAFFASITHEAQKDVVEALKAGDVENALCLFKQVSNNLEATRDMLNDRMLFLNINADPGATSKQKSFANDILRIEFTPGVADRGGSAKTHTYFKLYEEQCLKATLGVFAKAQANTHLSTKTEGERASTTSDPQTTAKIPSPRRGRSPNRHKRTRQQDKNSSPRLKPRAATSTKTKKKNSPAAT